MKHRTLILALQGLVLGFAAPAVARAEAAENCAQIADARARLACFDRQYPRGGRTAPAPGITTEAIPAPAPAPATTQVPHAPAPQTPVPQTPVPQTPPQTVSPQPVVTPEPQPAAPAAPASSSRGGLFSQTEKLDLDTEIAAIRRGNQQRMVFRLANNEIWMQNSPRELPFKTGDKVNIKNGKVGGYIMRSESGTSTRVKRIE